MNEEEKIMFMNMQAKVAQAENNSTKMNQAVTLFNAEESDNLIKWQLDIERSLLRIERLIRKQVPRRDVKGNTVYVDCPENELFNEYGINEIMNLLSWYVNKEVILSCYDEKQIDLIMHQFGEEVIDFLYTNLEKFGMDTEDKKKHYPMVCMNIINLVDATYRKAIDGLTLENLKTARVVTQTEPLIKGNMYPQINKSKGFSLMNPKTWRA